MTTDAVEAAQKLAQEGDRVLFITAIIVICTLLGGGLVWMTRYVITKMERMVDKTHEVTTSVVVAFEGTKNTIGRNTEALDNNSKVVSDCQTELIRCRERNYPAKV